MDIRTLASATAAAAAAAAAAAIQMAFQLVQRLGLPSVALL
jgi:hypothetical protein